MLQTWTRHYLDRWPEGRGQDGRRVPMGPTIGSPQCADVARRPAVRPCDDGSARRPRRASGQHLRPRRRVGGGGSTRTEDPERVVGSWGLTGIGRHDQEVGAHPDEHHGRNCHFEATLGTWCGGFRGGSGRGLRPGRRQSRCTEAWELTARARALVCTTTGDGGHGGGTMSGRRCGTGGRRGQGNGDGHGCGDQPSCAHTLGIGTPHPCLT